MHLAHGNINRSPTPYALLVFECDAIAGGAATKPVGKALCFRYPVNESLLRCKGFQILIMGFSR
jgi:hypothetical protein